MRVGQGRVESNRLARSRQRLIDLPEAIARHSQLERHMRRLAVDREQTLVDVSGLLMTAALVQHIAERLEGASGRRIESGRSPEIVGGRLELVAAQIGFAAAQVGERRIRPQGDRAAVGLDGTERLVVAERRRSLVEERAVRPLTRRRLIRPHPGHGGQDEQHGNGERPLHARSYFSVPGGKTGGIRPPRRPGRAELPGLRGV